jgi:SNF2 family DNA or RNA helicase
VNQPELFESVRTQKPQSLRELRIENNQRALELIENGAFNRQEVFELYTGTGGLIEPTDGDSSFAGSKLALGQYFTPPEIAKFIIDFLAIQKGTVLDNCCGHGSMFWHLPEGCYATGIEIQEEAYRVAKALYPQHCVVQDDCQNHVSQNQFDYVLINPPFGLWWKTDKNLDLVGYDGKILSHVACLELAIRAVRPSGFVACILPMGVKERQDMISFRRWYRNHAVAIAQVILPALAFVKQGTEAETFILFLQKLPVERREPFVVKSLSVGWDRHGNPKENDLPLILELWQEEEAYQDVRAYANSIRNPEQVIIGPKENEPEVERAYTAPEPHYNGQGLYLKKGAYRLILKPQDLLTALKLEEIKQLRCKRYYQQDEFKEMIELKEFYASDDNPKLLQFLEAYNIEYSVDSQLENWIEKKKRWWKRQSLPYRVYEEAELDKEIPTATDLYPELYNSYRKKLDSLGISACLYEYQRVDAARLACKNFSALLYDMGLGKTRTSVATALLNGNKRILIVCLSRLVKVWTDELDTLGITDYVVIKSFADVNKEALFTIVSYEKLSRQEPISIDSIPCADCGKSVTKLKCFCGWRRMKNLVCPNCKQESWKGHYCRLCDYTDRVWKTPLYKRLSKRIWGMVIVDESQSIKTKNSLRSQAVCSLKAKRKLLLTGTLIKGYVPDMFWQLHWCFGGGCPAFPYRWRGGSRQFINQFATYEYVTDEYSDTIQGKKKMVPKIKNLPEFWELMGPKAIRRLVDDPEVRVSIQLPEKTVKVVSIEMDDQQKAIYDYWFNNFVEWYRSQLEREEQDEDYTIKNAAILGQLWKLRQAATCPHVVSGLPEVSFYKRLHTNKTKALLKVLEQIPESQKAVIFTGYNPNAHLLATYLNTEELIGATPITQRNLAIEKFQKQEQPRILVVGLLAMNLGQTLTRANHAIMTDLDWCPSSMVQAEGRLLRISQEQPVNVTYLLSKDTIDEDIYELIYKKQAAINEGIDHKSYTEKISAISIREFVKEMLKRKEVKV